MSLRIAVYCTGGSKLGFGHFFRSKTFALSAPKNVSICLFPVIIDSNDRQVFEDVREITDFSDGEEAVIFKIKEFNPNIVVFDTVFCTDNFLKEIRETSKYLVSISPVFNQME